MFARLYAAHPAVVVFAIWMLMVLAALYYLERPRKRRVGDYRNLVLVAIAGLVACVATACTPSTIDRDPPPTAASRIVADRQSFLAETELLKRGYATPEGFNLTDRPPYYVLVSTTHEFCRVDARGWVLATTGDLFACRWQHVRLP